MKELKFVTKGQPEDVVIQVDDDVELNFETLAPLVKSKLESGEYELRLTSEHDELTVLMNVENPDNAHYEDVRKMVLTAYAEKPSDC